MPLILHVQGTCPACGERSLVADGLASFPGGRVRCSAPMCPDADAAAKLLDAKPSSQIRK